ncbi:FixH family protein [Ideonella sp.]|uniref:FixH family protein n=1 Tax=Ideonella sp. TaxID=1929293 RepID=UPI0035B1035A
MQRLSILASSLAAAVINAACMAPPKALDLALTRASDAGTYVVTLVPPVPAAAINRLHAWQIHLSTPDGLPVSHARIDVDGGMPQHGHGLPTQPQVTREPAPGAYVVEGVKFSMTGWWEIKLAIDGPAGADRVTFHTVVDPAVGR